MQWQTGFTWVHICDFGALWLITAIQNPGFGAICYLMYFPYMKWGNCSFEWACSTFDLLAWAIHGNSKLSSEAIDNDGRNLDSAGIAAFEFMVAPTLLLFVTPPCRAPWRKSMYIPATQTLHQKCSPGEVCAGGAQCRKLSAQDQAKT